MKICFVILRMGVGGAERMLAALGRGLADRGHQVAILSEGGVFVEGLQDAGVQHITVPGLASRRPLDQLRSVWRIRAALATLEPDLINVHAFTAMPATFVASLLAGSSARRLFTVHIPENYNYYLAMGPSLRIMVDDVSTVCAHTIDELHQHGLPDQMGTVIYNGIDPDWLKSPEDIEARPLPGAHTPVRLGVLARLLERKGIQDLIEALSMLGSQGVEQFELEVAGDGPYRPELEALIAKRGLSAQVKLLGEQRGARAFLDSLDLFVLPSHFEGLPMSMLEAMARGVPTLCTAVNGVPEVSIEGETGFLFKPLDVVGLVQALQDIVAEPERVRQVRRAARAQIEARFLTQQMVDGYERWFQHSFQRWSQGASA